MTLPANRLPNILRRMRRARNAKAGIVTCPASRDVAWMARVLRTQWAYDMLTRDRQHWAASLAATVEALWKARARILKLEAQLARAKRTAR